jgi:hypothetical protein
MWPQPLPAGGACARTVRAGTGRPGSTVELVIDGKVVGGATVGSDRKWKIAAELAEPAITRSVCKWLMPAARVLAATGR